MGAYVSLWKPAVNSGIIPQEPFTSFFCVWRGLWLAWRLLMRLHRLASKGRPRLFCVSLPQRWDYSKLHHSQFVASFPVGTTAPSPPISFLQTSFKQNAAIFTAESIVPILWMRSIDTGIKLPAAFLDSVRAIIWSHVIWLQNSPSLPFCCPARIYVGENSNATILELSPLHGRHLQWDTGLVRNQLRHGFSVLSVRRE